MRSTCWSACPGGKHAIRPAIEQVRAVALGEKEEDELIDAIRGASFAIGFEHEGLTYRWEAELEPRVGRGAEEHGALHAEEPPLIRTERVLEGTGPSWNARLSASF